MERKTVFITGANKNTGLAIAERFAKEGYNVALTSRNLENAQRTAKELEKNYGIKAKGYSLTLKDVRQIQKAFADVKETFGGLDVFVGNSANLGIDQEFMNITEEEFDDVINVNIKGNFFCCQQAAHLMKKKGKGAIVLIGSVHHHAAVWGRSLYAATKGAIRTMVRSMAFELAEYGIRVNQVVPGAIRTDRWDGVTDEVVAKRRINWPLGIESTGEDIANGVYFLASDQSKTITGTDLTIDSGILACLLTYNGGKH